MKTNAHITYKTKDGAVVPGSTTISGTIGWNKQVLVNWANRMGREGIDTKKFKDDKAEIGTLGHAFSIARLTGETVDTDDYSKNQIKSAENSLASFDNWLKEHIVEPVLMETPIVSERYRFGGTPDIYGKVDGVYEVIDIKTGSGIYPEHYIQTASYKQLLIESGNPVDRVRILNIPRTDNECFDDKIVPHIDSYWSIFLHLLDIYYINKSIKGGG